MFDTLSERLQAALSDVRSRGKLTEDDINKAMRAIRLALLEAGLQGSGKTTACAKLARHLRDEHKMDVALAACDVYRPAAVDQLVKVGHQAGATVYEQGSGRDPVDIAEWALGRAKADGRDVLIVDTSGRLHIDAELMEELANVKRRTKPHDVLLVVDAMTGQDAVNVAGRFADTA